MRQYSPARVLKSVRGDAACKRHETDGKLVCNACSQFVRKVKLVVSGSQCAILSLRADSHVIQVLLNCELSKAKRFILIHVDFEGILG